MDNSKKYETPEAKEALIDGLSLICQRLHEFYDGKTNQYHAYLKASSKLYHCLNVSSITKYQVRRYLWQ